MIQLNTVSQIVAHLLTFAMPKCIKMYFLILGLGLLHRNAWMLVELWTQNKRARTYEFFELKFFRGSSGILGVPGIVQTM